VQIPAETGDDALEQVMLLRLVALLERRTPSSTSPNPTRFESM
jgi:hypothetical protein